MIFHTVTLNILSIFFILSSSLVYEKSYTLGQIDFTTSLLLLVCKYMNFHTLQNNCQMKLLQN